MKISNPVLRCLAGSGIVLAAVGWFFSFAFTIEWLIEILADETIKFQWYHGVVMTLGLAPIALLIVAVAGILVGNELFEPEKNKWRPPPP